MQVLLLFLLVPIVFAAVLISSRKPFAAGWVLVGFGIFFLVHGGVSIATIAAHGNVVPAYVNYYLIFITVPAGVLLLLAGGMVFGVRACAVRLTKYCRR